MNRTWMRVTLVAAALGGIALGAWAGPDGKALYGAKCASCHGKDGQGNPAMAKMFKVPPAVMDLTVSSTTAKTDVALEAVIRDGRGKMPAFKGKLVGQDFGAVVRHLRGLAPAKR